MTSDGKYRFTMNGRGGRCGTITCHEADRYVEFGWEALVDPPGGTWLYPLRGEWASPKGMKIDEERRLTILQKLYQWLKDQGIQIQSSGFSLLQSLREEIAPKGTEIDLEHQLKRLHRLRQQLKDQGIPSDLDLPSEMEITDRRCAWRECRERTIKGSAYCPYHYDLNLLGALNEPAPKGIRPTPGG